MNADRGAYRTVNQHLTHYACVLWGAGIWYKALQIRALAGKVVKKAQREGGIKDILITDTTDTPCKNVSVVF